MKLKNVIIHKYKCIENDQLFDVEKDVTVLVGMNESGKTSILEAIAKTNYFQEDENFTFTKTHDYPRREKKKIDKSGEDPQAITCCYVIPIYLIEEIENEIGKEVFKLKEFCITTKYSNDEAWGNIEVDFRKFITYKTKELGIFSQTLNEKLYKISNKIELETLAKEYTEEKYTIGIESLKKYFLQEWNWSQNPLGEYIARTYLKPNIPKFLYYDEYYALPPRINIEKLNAGQLDESKFKTAKALFELADINTDEILNANNFEDFIAELEATESIISDELFKYWKTNKNLNITFKIEPIEKTDNQNNKRIIEHILDIRVKHKGVSLSLKNRSKGFNWFFSFLVWFKKIQEDNSSNYILLLDEPGLNLHASAQEDLLNFIEDLSMDYQVLYTTHSPFMISSEKLNRVRTVLETKNGALISDSIQEKDPNTLFPLQAALGYNIAQNLYISKNNLLVEGVSDMIFLQTMSAILDSNKKQGLDPNITLVPTGGLEKVATFISLLRSNDLKIVCLLDTFKDAKGKVKLENMVKQKIINQKNIRFYHEFIPKQKYADVEDLFEKEDYLKLFNSAFYEYKDVELENMNSDIEAIIFQIYDHLSLSHFNHYRPANQLLKNGQTINDFHVSTIENFEKVFKEINKLFK